jgi:hypothetical protein
MRVKGNDFASFHDLDILFWNDSDSAVFVVVDFISMEYRQNESEKICFS